MAGKLPESITFVIRLSVQYIIESKIKTGKLVSLVDQIYKGYTMKERKTIFTCIMFFVSVLFIEAGTLKGHVKYDGKPPKKKRLRMDAEPVCGAAHSGSVYNENFKMAADGSMEEALIYLKGVSY